MIPERFTRSELAAAAGIASADLVGELQRACQAGEVVKDEPETLLCRAPCAAGGWAWWKLYRVPPRRRAGTPLIRSRALREWRALWAMRQRGLPTPEPLAFAEDRSGGLLRASLLVTREVSGARDLREWLVHGAASGAVRRRLLEAAGQAARRLHDAGFAHFRLQLRNLLAVKDRLDEELVVLDAPYACQFVGAAPPRAQAVDLVDLAGATSGLSPEDGRTVLYAHAGADPPVLSVRQLTGRKPLPQKLRRIAYYLLYTHTGHRPLGRPA